MSTYVHQGPVYHNGRVWDDNYEMVTEAPTIGRAYANFLHRLGDNFSIFKSNIKEVKVDVPVERCYNTCEYCGYVLTDGGQCPVCDFGETDLLDDYRRLRNIKD